MSPKRLGAIIIYTHIIYGHTLFDNFGPLVSFVYFWSTTKNINFEWGHPMKILTTFDFNWPSGFREED
jgi:hypothetical protein